MVKSGNDLLWYHFVIYKNIKSLCCTPETDIMLKINFNLKQKESGNYLSLQVLDSGCQPLSSFPDLCCRSAIIGRHNERTGSSFPHSVLTLRVRALPQG